MLTITFLIKNIIDFYVMVLLLRIWMQWIHIDFYNPFSQFLVKITQPLITPIRRILPLWGSFDSAALLLSLLIMTIKYPLLLLIQNGTISLISYNWLFGFIALGKLAGYLVFWSIFIRILMNWISPVNNHIEYIIHQLTEPLIAPIRRMMPVVCGVDFSAMILILGLYLLNYLGIDLFSDLWFLL